MGTGIVTRIILGFMILYFSLIFLVFGLFFEEMLEELGEGGNRILGLHRYIFYYLLFDLVIRVMFQEVTDVKFRELALLPISKSNIIHFILGSSVISFFNFLPLIFVVPAALSTIHPEYGTLSTIIWILSLFILLLFNNFLALQFKNWIANRIWLYPVIALCLGSIYLTDITTDHIVSSLFHSFMVCIPHFLAPLGTFLLTTVLIYRVNFSRMRNQAYVQERKATSTIFEKFNFEGLSERGFYGLIYQLNLHQIFRNKRIRTQVIMGFIILLAGPFLFNSEYYSGKGWQLFWGFYMTGILPLSLAQYLWSYQGDQIELIWSLPFSLERYVRAQYYFFILAALATTIPAMLYYFMDPALIPVFIVCFLYHIGVLIPFLMFAAAYNQKKLEINTTGTFNFQGIKGRQFVFIFGVLLAPIIIFAPFHVWGFTNLGLMVIGGIGLLGFLFHPLLLRGVAHNTMEKKYKLTEGFRSNN